MRFTTMMVCTLLLRSVVLAQPENPNLRVNLATFQYPPLAAAARVQGEVIFEISASGQKLMSGHPLLAPSAQSNLATWTLPTLRSKEYLISINYHLEMIPPGAKQQTVLIGDRLDRFFLRLLKLPTKKVVSSCYRNPALTPPARYTVVKNGDDYAVDVFVTEQAWCVVENYRLS